MRSHGRPSRAALIVPVAVAGVGLLLSGCGAPDPARGLEIAPDIHARQVAVSDADALPAVVDATRRIGTTMLQDAPGDANAVVSPSSVTVALSMLADGARASTLTELEQVLGASGKGRRDAVAALRGVLLRYDGDPGVVRAKTLPAQPMVHLATQVAVDDQLRPSAEYLGALADGYGVGVQHVDLGSGAGKSALDDWVRYHSGGLAEKSAIRPGPDLRLVLQDAIVLAARWETPFAEYATSDRPFTLADGTQVDTQTMANGVTAAFAEVDGWRALRLPYVGGQLHADLVLPPSGTDPAYATPELLAALDEALAGAENQRVELWLPTLDVKSEGLDLRETIGALGAPSVLDPDAADLTGMGTDVDGNRLFLGQAVQQAVLQVDEEGTRAAAVTELGATGSGAPAEPTVTLHLDRPFLVELAHTSTSWPLFLAAIPDPRH
ncbi:serpin family protein [Xylanimonas sp. McL0601]|uniref:serpin family protein n=1 Tax=Xylanimonas sp. McL0601 TaxID=3414739 RepID=UPI003CF4D7E1